MKDSPPERGQLIIEAITRIALMTQYNHQSTNSNYQIFDHLIQQEKANIRTLIDESKKHERIEIITALEDEQKILEDQLEHVKKSQFEIKEWVREVSRVITFPRSISNALDGLVHSPKKWYPHALKILIETLDYIETL